MDHVTGNDQIGFSASRGNHGNTKRDKEKEEEWAAETNQICCDHPLELFNRLLPSFLPDFRKQLLIIISFIVSRSEGWAGRRGLKSGMGKAKNRFIKNSNKLNNLTSGIPAQSQTGNFIEQRTIPDIDASNNTELQLWKPIKGGKRRSICIWANEPNLNPFMSAGKSGEITWSSEL
jgi:hypothetical protein